MNPLILLFMKYLSDDSFVTEQELIDAANTADYFYSNFATAYAADLVDEYFEGSAEDKRTYIDEINKKDFMKFKQLRSLIICYYTE
jgi:hypothetical protein